MSRGWRTVCQEAGDRHDKLEIGMSNTQIDLTNCFTYLTPASEDFFTHLTPASGRSHISPMLHKVSGKIR